MLNLDAPFFGTASRADLRDENARLWRMVHRVADDLEALHTALGIVAGGEDERLTAWDEIVDHPFFKSCFDTDGPLLDAMVARLDEAHARTPGKFGRNEYARRAEPALLPSARALPSTFAPYTPDDTVVRRYQEDA